MLTQQADSDTDALEYLYNNSHTLTELTSQLEWTTPQRCSLVRGFYQHSKNDHIMFFFSQRSHSKQVCPL